MQIDFLGMQAFLSIVEQGGFLPAAAHLNLSQTAISHRLRKLEDSLGMKLLTRTTRTITLTDAGRALLPRVRKAMQELELSYDTVRQHAQAAPRWLVFGCLPTLAATQLSPALRHFAAQYPDMAVRVLDDSIGEIAEHVNNGTAAFGVSLASSNRFGLDMQVFAEEPFVLVCPARHRLARHKRLEWEQLRNEALIRISLPAGNAATIDDALGERRLQFRWTYEAQRTSIALDLVANGLGLTVVPALCALHAHGLVMRPLRGPRVTRHLAIVSRRDTAPAPAAQAMRDILTDQIRQQLAVIDEQGE
ncbi:MAG: LysR substrate-binding domain-containing protein [Pigmentiphaga sp.]|uniref:LysR family transcriptional regulator n=1 Tax=Pigmentiphaga sp. TaxID=1977564 RepID=UPI0029A7D590|nr:LysR substrate-binding domain-containing protein [Pigmentiphaga sp.]MDX3907078.1 LysR substrate-binding domain-containing protein [Pigmentiphaga sp.]